MHTHVSVCVSLCCSLFPILVEYDERLPRHRLTSYTSKYYRNRGNAHPPSKNVSLISILLVPTMADQKEVVGTKSCGITGITSF